MQPLTCAGILKNFTRGLLTKKISCCSCLFVIFLCNCYHCYYVRIGWVGWVL